MPEVIGEASSEKTLVILMMVAELFIIATKKCFVAPACHRALQQLQCAYIGNS
jgi:hypothetical protein